MRGEEVGKRAPRGQHRSSCQSVAWIQLTSRYDCQELLLLVLLYLGYLYGEPGFVRDQTNTMGCWVSGQEEVTMRREESSQSEKTLCNEVSGAKERCPT